MFETLYHYKARVVKVYDGDTITVDIDLGLNIWLKNQKIRLAKINAPEVTGTEKPEGIISREFLKDLIFNNDVILRTVKDRKGKYGRFLGIIYVKYGDHPYFNVNEYLVEEGFAEEREY